MHSITMKTRCLIIADDLTGGADSGARFAACGLKTLLISPGDIEGSVDLGGYPAWDVLVVNAETRRMPPDQASRFLSALLKSYRKEDFPVVYKKIDSTLRGNVGQETDAVLNATGLQVAFLTPSFPEQSRAVVGGILTVNGSPLSLADLSRSRIAATDSHVRNIVARQSRFPVGLVDLDRVAGGPESVRQALAEERERGARIVSFDAVRHRDLGNIAAVAFEMDRVPLLIGSAGLAGEVAKILAGECTGPPPGPAFEAECPPPRVFFVCGSRSGVTHAQIDHVVGTRGVASFETERGLVGLSGDALSEALDALARSLERALETGNALLRSCPGAVDFPGSSRKIRRILQETARRVLRKFVGRKDRPVLVITGGATASGVLGILGTRGVELHGEIIDGVAWGRLAGGELDGLVVVTKAGGFGEPDCFSRIIRLLEEPVGICAMEKQRTEVGYE